MDNYLQDLVWMSYRYCIGRKSISCLMHASNIAKYSYNELTDEQKEFMAHDIRREINGKFNFQNIICSDYRNHIPKDGLSILLEEIFFSGYDLSTIDKYQYTIRDGVVTNIQELDVVTKFDTIKSLYEDFSPWIKLANAFDIKQHVEIETEYGGKREIHRCFKMPYINYNNQIGIKYIDIESYLKNPHSDISIRQECIVKYGVDKSM